MLFIILLYVITVIISFFSARKIAMEAVQNAKDLVLLAFGIFIPIINIIITFMLLLDYLEDKKNVQKVTKRVFLIKEDSANDNFKGKGYR